MCGRQNFGKSFGIKKKKTKKKWCQAMRVVCYFTLSSARALLSPLLPRQRNDDDDLNFTKHKIQKKKKKEKLVCSGENTKIT